MAVDILNLGFRVDTAPVKNASKDLDKLSESAKGTGKSLSNMGGDADKASKLTNTLASSIRGLGAAVGVAYIGRMADEYTKLTAQLKIATGSQDQYNAALKEVSRIANAAQADIGSIAVLYARLSNTLKDVGVNQSQISKVSETVALALKVSGASAGEAASTMLQLSQAFASGVLRGEEFNAVSEASFPLMKALADSMGVPIGALRELASNGQITRTELLKAFGDDKLLAMFRDQAKQINTIGGAFTNLKNSFIQITGIFAEKTGVVDLFTTAIKDLNSVLLVLAGISDFDFKLDKFLPDYKKYLANQKKEGDLAPAASFGGKQILASGSRMDAPLPRIDIGNIKDANVKYDKLKATFLGWQKNNPLKDAISAQREYTANIELINQAQAKGIISLQEGDRYRAQLYKDLKKNDKTNTDDKVKAYQQMKKEFAAMDEKYNEIATDAENKVLNQRKKNEQEAYENKIKYLDLAYARSQKEFEEARRQQEEIAKKQEELAKDINKSITDALMRGFEKGVSFARNFKNTLVNMFKSMILQPVISFIIDSSGISKVLALLGGTISTAAGAATGTSADAAGGGFMNTANNLFSILKNTNQSIISGIENVGAYIADGLGGIRDSIGGFVGQNSAAIADGFSYAGALFQATQGNYTGAIGTAIGTYFGGPIGGAIGSMLGSAVGGLFGGGTPKLPRYTSVVNSSYNNGKFTSGAPNVGGSGAVGLIPGAGDSLTALNKAFTGMVGGLLEAAGQTAKIESTAILYKKNNSFGRFAYNINNGQQSVDMSVMGGEDANATFQNFANTVLTSVLIGAIKSSKLESGIKALFNGLTDKTQVANMVSASIGLYNSQKALGDRFGLTADQAAKVAINTGLAGDELTAFINKIANAAGSFKKIGDVLIDAKAKLADLLGGSVPSNLKEFDQALKGIDKTTQAGIDAFGNMFALRDQFIAFTSSIDSIKGGVKGALFGMVSDAEKQSMLQADLNSIFTELGYSVPNSVNDLIELGKSIDYTTAEGINLASVFPTLASAFMQTKQQVDGVAQSLNALDTNNFKSLVDLTRAQRYVDNGINLNNLPSYDVGTSYVQGDQVAKIHNGERVITAADNRALMARLTNPDSNSAALLTEVSRLRQENQAQQIAIAQATQKMAKILDKFDDQGIVLSETNNSGTRVILDTRTVA